MLVLCSRNARPEKGLVRRPHVDQHGCLLPKGECKQARKDQLDGCCSFDVRSEGQSGDSPVGR
jgi:hypothetical protein